MQTYRYRYRQPHSNRGDNKTEKQSNLFNRFSLAVIVIFFAFIVVGLINNHVNASTQSIKSGYHGDCIDNYNDSETANSKVDIWNCNGSSAQAWSTGMGSIRLDKNYCLDVQNNKVSAGSPVVLGDCNLSAGEVWLRDGTGYLNPNSGLCLDSPSDAEGTQLNVSSCAKLYKANETWNSTDHSGDGSTSPCGQGTEGERVACYAEAEWTAWQSGNPTHNDLLNKYTDGNGYEEWCADFVSFVFKEAGYPFSQGERDGWDEYNANNIQYMSGFTIHQAGSYVPRAGDVGFFDYPGGHVEIVVSGGSTPTFVYGDSAVNDSSTGNGDMAANSLISVASLGQVEYYLSPPSSTY